MASMKLGKEVFVLRGGFLALPARVSFGDEVSKGALCTLFLWVGGEGDGSLNPDSGVGGEEGATEESWAGGTEAWLRLATGVDASSPENE